MRKKVCFVSTTSITMKCFIVPIASALAAEGVDVTLVSSADESMFAICREKGLKYQPIQMGRGIDFSALRSIRELEKYFKSEKFDLVQYCTPNAACYASIASRIADVPIRLYCQWGIRYAGFSGVKRFVFKQIEKLVCRLSTDVRAVSWKNKDFAVSEGLYKADKAKVVGNGGTIGVDLSVFDVVRREEFNAEIRDAYGIPRDSFVFGFCGRLSRDKGSAELLETFRDICAIDPSVRLFIVGDVEGDAGIDRALFEWAKNSEVVVFTGKIPTEEVYRYYAPMDVLVHPTYREGFGMVVQEAGAFGIPCVTTKIPGASEVMEDGKSCVLVAPKDVKGLEEAMTRLLKSRETVRRLGAEARRRVETLYAREIMLEYQKKDYLETLG